MKLYLNKKPTEKEKELFGKKNKIPLFANWTYWLEGGEKSSRNVRGDFLIVRNITGYGGGDIIYITVLWVELLAETTGNVTTSPQYDGYENVVNLIGHGRLGVQRNGRGNFSERWVHGIIEIVGSLYPDKLNFDEKITTDFERTEDSIPAKAKFGFAFRRIVNSKRYSLGMKEPYQTLVDKIDDSIRDYQDVDPSEYLYCQTIYDVDGPNNIVTPTLYFMHGRMNFIEHVVFHFYKEKPERCSKKLMWAFTSDISIDYDDKLTFILGKPNNGDRINEVLADENLENLNINIESPNPKNVSVLEISKGETISIVSLLIEGENLVGMYILKKGKDRYLAESVKVKALERFSDLKESKSVFFIPTNELNDEFEFTIENADAPEGSEPIKIKLISEKK